MMRPLPSSSSTPPAISPTPLHLLYAERRAAAARRLDVRVLELEACTLETLDVIDLGTDEVHQAHLVDDALHALDLELAIDLGRHVEIEVVRESGAATTDDAKAKRVIGFDALGVADLADL